MGSLLKLPGRANRLYPYKKRRVYAGLRDFRAAAAMGPDRSLHKKRKGFDFSLPFSQYI